MKKIFNLLFIILLTFFIVGCKTEEKEEPHTCVPSEEWVLEEGDYKCGDQAVYLQLCEICGATLDVEIKKINHKYIYRTEPATCTTNGKNITECENCDYHYETEIFAQGHGVLDYRIKEEATQDKYGIREQYCTTCNESIKETAYANNGYFAHGKLSVKGADLVDKNGKKYQLYGLSYHGLQWFGKYVNEATICAIQDNFGVNIIRLACYSSEGGYAEGGERVKENYKKYIDTAIKTAAKIGLYVLVDWHMLGAEFEPDENPLYYMEEAKEFFSYVSSTYKDYDNVLYEIMNEPSGSATWADCKKYANTIIPIIRENTDAIVLVGNPHWSADLVSVMKDPLVGYKNIMYTTHFYASDYKDYTQVTNAYSKGFPVFITEYGFMDSDGDKALDYRSGEAWLKQLDQRNISYIAWNISNSKGSSSIIKAGNQTMTDFTDDNLKEWGQYLRKLYRSKAGLPDDTK